MNDEIPMRKTLDESIKGMGLVIIALLKPNTKAGVMFLEAVKPKHLARDIWEDARTAVRMARRRR